MARGESRIRGFSPAGDCERTLALLCNLGIALTRNGPVVWIEGRGTRALVPARDPLDCGRSGTTMRLGMGLLAGQSFTSTLTGDAQLLRRPMDRVARPLRAMGAKVQLEAERFPPATVRGGSLQGIHHTLPVASAQVKSAVLVAGIQASGTTTVVEPVSTRDHTERLLEAMGASVERSERAGGRSTSVRAVTLQPIQFDVPGDPSSAAPLVVAAALAPGSDLLIEGVGLNEGRTVYLRILERMGGSVEIVRREDGVEPQGDLRVRGGDLVGTTVEPDEVPGAIDELPLIGLLATQAEGVTEVRGAGDLRNKESDRIEGLVAGLRALGADVDELPDGFIVRGPTPLHEGRCDARSDHRLAMTFAVAALVVRGEVSVDGMEFVPDSFPGFEALLARLT
jgi:3-phosphoshikimate 1-carboxyvinyltransferase